MFGMRVALSPSCVHAPAQVPLNIARRPCHHCSTRRQGLQKWPHHKISAMAADSVEEDLSDNDLYDEFEGLRKHDRGYTPFEFIDFTDIAMKHEVSIWVDRSIEDSYRVWDNRLNWMQWFDMIDEVGFHEEHPSYISMYLWYRWATTPFLELYVTLERTKAEANKYIIEEPVEGLPLVAAVLFQEGYESDDGSDDVSGGTTVTLRISYLLPKVLYEFAGQLAVYADVDKKLTMCMRRMKAFIEGTNLTELEEAMKENEAVIKANFAAQKERKARALKRREQRMQEWTAEVENMDSDVDGVDAERQLEEDAEEDASSSSGGFFRGEREEEEEEEEQLEEVSPAEAGGASGPTIRRRRAPKDGSAMANPASGTKRRSRTKKDAP